jgi:hypothetical protein
MATLNELRTLVRTELGEPSAGYWSDTQLNSYVNAAAARFSVETGLLLAPPRKADVEAAHALYNLPDDCPGAQAVVGVFLDGDELSPTSPAALIRLGKKPHSDTGTPTHWYAVADSGVVCLALYPVPASTTADGLILWYWKIASVMSADESACEIPDEYIRGVVYAAAELAFLAKRETGQSAGFRGLYAEEVRRARASAESLIAASLQHRDTSADTVRTIF